MKITNENRDRAKGMLMGLMIGDALGSPLQFNHDPNRKFITEMEPCETFGVPAGYWTDDGSMALCIIRSFVACNGYNPYSIAQTFLKWLDDGYMSSTGYSFDVGLGTRASLEHFRQTGSLVNGSEEDQGNGSIMRYAPAYLVANGDAGITHAISDITHASAKVRETCDKFSRILDSHLSGIKTSEPCMYSSLADASASGWAVTSLETALCAFNTSTSFEECLINVVNLGGDADTIGAIAGQIAGAWYGFNAIPKRWLEALHDSKNIEKVIDIFLDAVIKKYS